MTLSCMDAMLMCKLVCVVTHTYKSQSMCKHLVHVPGVNNSVLCDSCQICIVYFHPKSKQHAKTAERLTKTFFGKEWPK